MFDEHGFVGPVPLFTPRECRRLLPGLQSASTPPSWLKGQGASSPHFFALAREPRIVDRVARLIGDDVMLWGACLRRRAPGERHAWHTDSETAAHAGGTVSVWIGLENVDRLSALRVVPRSHRLGVSVQERSAAAGRARDAISDEDVAAWAGEEALDLDLGVGDAVFFDGRLWHGSENRRPRGDRHAVLLQYARPELPIRASDGTRPPCVMVRGRASGAPNDIVAGPRAGGGSWARTLPLPLEADPRTGYRAYALSAGTTRNAGVLGCHGSALDPGRSPHPPHRHPEEEILIVLDGEPELALVDAGGAARRQRVAPGTVAYYPAGQLHTIHNPSARAASYVMFKWRGAPARRPGALATGVFPLAPPAGDVPASNGLRSREVFEGPTSHLRRLRCHVSVLAPRGGYPAHVDAYDVALIVLAGTLETGGRRLGPGAVVYFTAGEPHDLGNPGDATATYLVLELEGAPGLAALAPLELARLATRRLVKVAPRALVELAPRRLRQAVRRFAV
jgi:quercetin dioxygenase-like cupin family protein